MAHKALIEGAFLALAGLAVIVILETSGIVRTGMATILMFALPGRAFLAAWFPHRTRDASAYILLTITLSMAIAAIGGILLNMLSLGLQTQTWALWLGGVAIINGIIAIARNLFRPKLGASGQGQGRSLRTGQALLIVLAAIGVVGAIAVARIGALNQPRPGFTQLWLIPGENSDTVHVGIQNEEGTPMSYWLTVRQGELPIKAYYDIQIDAASTWDATIHLPANPINPNQPIQAQLYRAEQPDTMYRSVTLWMSDDS